MELCMGTQQDREVMGAIWLTSSIAAHPALGEDYFLRQYGEVYHQLLPGTKLWAAWQDGAVEAFAGVKNGQIFFLNTAVCFQKKGHGSALLEKLKQENPAGLFAQLYPENEHGIAFVEKRGFTRFAQDDKDAANVVLLRWQQNQ